jgi:hypothetical protein
MNTTIEKIRSQVLWTIELLKELQPDAGSPEADLLDNLKTTIKQFDKAREEETKPIGKSDLIKRPRPL